MDRIGVTASDSDQPAPPSRSEPTEDPVAPTAERAGYVQNTTTDAPGYPDTAIIIEGEGQYTFTLNGESTTRELTDADGAHVFFCNEADVGAVNIVHEGDVSMRIENAEEAHEVVA